MTKNKIQEIKVGSATKLIKNIINVKHSVIDDIQISKSSDGIVSIAVYLHPIKSYSDRCPHCGKRCPIYDRSKTYKKWRALDCGGIIVELYASSVLYFITRCA